MKFKKGEKVKGRTSGKVYIILSGHYQHIYLYRGDDYRPYYVVRSVDGGKEKRIYESDLLGS